MAAAKLYLLVKVDINDADYIEQLTPTTYTDVKILKPLLTAIEEFKPYRAKADGRMWRHDNNFPYGELCRDDLGEKGPEELYSDHADAFNLFAEKYLPLDETGSCHTVVKVRVLHVTEEETLLGDH